MHSLVMDCCKLAGSHESERCDFFTLTSDSKFFFLTFCCNQRSHDKSLIFCKLTPWTSLNSLLTTLECLALTVKLVQAAAALCYGMFTNTTMSFSSMVGPAEKVEFYGHPIIYIAPSVYGHPHVTLASH